MVLATLVHRRLQEKWVLGLRWSPSGISSGVLFLGTSWFQAMEPFEAVGQDLSLFQDVFALPGQGRILPFLPKDAVNHRPGHL